MKINYTFPSKKKIEKLPVIKVVGDESRFNAWMTEHKEIDGRVPPLFKEFVVTGDRYYLVVCYNDTITGLYIKGYFEGMYIGTLFADYNSYVDGTIQIDMDASPSVEEKVKEEWIHQFFSSAFCLVIGVQAYILYHKPEIVEQIYTPGEERKPSTNRKRITQQPIKVRKTKIKRITLTEQDKPQKEIHYNKLSWHVRGHYRHVGKDKHLVYIQPSVRNRNGKKYSLKGRKYEIED